MLLGGKGESALDTPVCGPPCRATGTSSAPLGAGDRPPTSGAYWGALSGLTVYASTPDAGSPRASVLWCESPASRYRPAAFSSSIPNAGPVDGGFSVEVPGPPRSKLCERQAPPWHETRLPPSGDTSPHGPRDHRSGAEYMPFPRVRVYCRPAMDPKHGAFRQHQRARERPPRWFWMVSRSMIASCANLRPILDKPLERKA